MGRFHIVRQEPDGRLLNELWLVKDSSCGDTLNDLTHEQAYKAAQMMERAFGNGQANRAAAIRRLLGAKEETEPTGW